jgi:hypothetical protein
MARLARAWWLNLYNLDELEDGSEPALNAFAKGITGTLHLLPDGERPARLMSERDARGPED